MKYDNQLRYASEIVKEYDGKIPLSAWLKNYFRLNKQMGSNDRKTISEMVYGYYRLGANEFNSVEERLLSFISISENIPSLTDYFFDNYKNASLRDGAKIFTGKIFPFKAHLSDGIDADAFAASFLKRPEVFIRVRPSFEKTTIEKLTSNGIPFNKCGDHCFALPGSTKIESVLELDKEAVVQDKSSQRTGDFMRIAAEGISRKPAVWDCCAASGGKSILAFDLLNAPQLTVSDKRESIIHNLTQRFGRAGITNYKSFVADLSHPQTNIPSNSYDLVIADVPCSGSGTWGRTPEQLYFFREQQIEYYSTLQRKIVSRVAPSVRPNGFLLYITCSVFAHENELNAKFLQESLDLTPVKAELIKGYHEKADTLYAALFTNRSA